MSDNTHLMRVTIYIFGIFLSACGQNADTHNLTQISNWSAPYIIDSLPTTDNSHHATEMKVPFNDIAYVGLLSDTIRLHKYERYKLDSYLDFQGFQDSLAVKDGLKIMISSRQLLTIDLEDYSIPPPPTLIENNEDFDIDSIKTAKTYLQWGASSRNLVQAIPVFIYNPTKDTIYLDQQDGRVLMIQEAKNENGEWKPIENWRYSWCGNSYGVVGALPKNIALVKVFKYVGDFETEIRIKLKIGHKTIYSESFKGAINKKQFDLPADIRENYLAKELDDNEFLEWIFLNK